MGERRNHKLFWDTEDETKLVSAMREHSSWAGKEHHSSHGSGRYHEFSDSRSTSAQDARDHPGWSSWEKIEPTEPMSRNFKNTYEEKEVSGGKRYHKNISPGFEEMELDDYNHSHEYDRIHPRRYMGKGRSRSPSRSRTLGRSRSRSLSIGRERVRERDRVRERETEREREIEREMEREMGRGRDWSRSRSRSRSDGYGFTNDHRRSGSPIGDYRRQSHGWSDKRSGPEKSSQTCRDFASGRCRKGSQCRFFHPTSISHRDGDLLEDDRIESWRSRSDRGQISKHLYTRLGFESRDRVSDLYEEEEEQFMNRRSRNPIPCRDFKQGYCRWGDNCRFSHDAASGSFAQDTRNPAFDKEDFDHRQHKNGKPLCKFFAAGKCSRDNCRFSHEDPNLNNIEGRLDKVTESQSSHGKSNWRKWDDVPRTSDTPNSTGWGEPIRDNSRFSHEEPTLNNLEGKLDKVTENQSSHGKNNWRKWDDVARTSDNPNSTGWGEPIRDNCRFSHEDPTLNNLEGRLDKVAENQSSHDKSNWRNARKWDDAMKTPDTSNSTGWGEAIATNTTGTGDVTNGQGDGGWNLNSKNVNKWGIQDWTSKSLDSERQPSHLGETGGYGGETGTAKSIALDNLPNEQEHLVLHGLHLQNKDSIEKLHGPSALEENQSLTVEASEQNVPPASSHIEQQHSGVIKSKPMTLFGSSILDEVKETRYTNHPALPSGQSFNPNGTSVFPGHLSVSSESDRLQNMLYANVPNGHGTDWKRPEAHTINPSNVQTHGQTDTNTFLSPGLLEAQVPQILTNLLTSIRSDKVSNSPVTKDGQNVSVVIDPVSLIQSFVNEQSQRYARTDVSSSKGMLPSFSGITGSLPVVSNTDVEDNINAVSHDQFNSMRKDREYAEPDKHNVAQGTHENNQMQLRRSSPSSVVGAGVESPKLKHPESPRQQVEVVENLGVTGDSKATIEESKDIQENKPSEDVQGKLEEGGASKDEKGIRLFKNSLVELVKDILKPTWKEGRMSRDVHKNVVKKVVDKVSSAIQADQIPKTQDKIDQYLSLSKPKITKLVQAYVERCRKPDA